VQQVEQRAKRANERDRIVWIAGLTYQRLRVTVLSGRVSAKPSAIAA
jgi:hypothetical protein